jgi:TctA family transporter
MLGFILGPMLEENFRRAMLLTRGSFVEMAHRPIAGTLFSLVAAFIVWQMGLAVWKLRKGGGRMAPAVATH